MRTPPQAHRPTRRATLLGLAGAIGATALTIEPQRAAAAAPLVGPASGNRIHLMSFNIRRIVPESVAPSVDAWDVRRPAVESLLRSEQPTILGLQEAKLPQLDAIRRALPHHELVGDLTPDPDQYEYNPIVVDRRRFTVQEWGQRWLSDTPSVKGSSSWGNTVPRFATWAVLTDRASARRILVVNTHLDHLSENSRVRSASTIQELRRAVASMPTVVTGDFNTAAGTSEPYRVLTSSAPQLTDSWTGAAARLTPAYGTLPGYRAPVVNGTRLDWLLTAHLRVHSAAVNTTKPNGVWPSDHAPVHAVVSHV